MKGRLVAYGDDENDDDDTSGNDSSSGGSNVRLGSEASSSSSTIPRFSNVNTNINVNRNVNPNPRASQSPSRSITTTTTTTRLSSGSGSGSGSMGKLPISGVPPTAPKPLNRHGIAIRRPPTNHRAQTRVTRVAHASPSASTSGPDRQPPASESSTSPSGGKSIERHTRSLGDAEDDNNDDDGQDRDDDMDISPPPPASQSQSQSHSSLETPDSTNDEEQELTLLRRALRPKDIPGVQDWGIPPAPTGDVDPEVLTTLSSFLTLKHHPTHPRHFNDALMSNKAFRNPHLYANLVEWAGVDEKVSCFPGGVWEGEVDGGWYAEAVCEAQKKRADKEKESQKKRSHIDFTSGGASASASAPLYGGAQTKRLNVGAGGKLTRWG